MPARYRPAVPADRFVIVDADMLAGWRRPTSSLDQLHDAVGQLRRQEPDVGIAVVGDPALKWALPESEHDRLELDITSRSIVFAPAGTVGGHKGFISRCVETARDRGLSPVVLSDQAIPGAPLIRVRRDMAGQWVFDLDTVVTTTAAAVAAADAASHGGHHRRRGRR